MDEIVHRAMRKWPNVPHCYGWLALDARGNWRMRDEHAQQCNFAGDKIVHAALLAFINRNYASDTAGCWYFQNGPQRVYVNLEATPFIARTDPADGLILHTGDPITAIDAVWLTDTGKLILCTAERIALVDDRDLGHCLQWVRTATGVIDDQCLLNWIADPADHIAPMLTYRKQTIPIGHLTESSIAERFGFTPAPLPQ